MATSSTVVNTTRLQKNITPENLNQYVVWWHLSNISFQFHNKEEEGGIQPPLVQENSMSRFYSSYLVKQEFILTTPEESVGTVKKQTKQYAKGN